MKKLYTVQEISEMYGVTTMGVRYWLSKGLKFETERVIGIKPRKVINPKDVDEFLNLTRR